MTLGRRIPRSQESKSTAVLATDGCDPAELEESEVEDVVVVDARDYTALGDCSEASLARNPDDGGARGFAEHYSEHCDGRGDYLAPAPGIGAAIVISGDSPAMHDGPDAVTMGGGMGGGTVSLSHSSP